MQGFILKVTKVRDEDCIVEILTNQNLIKCYRFYGARHSSIIQGYKIDFEVENSLNFLPRLKNTMHLGFSWLISRDRLIYWQQFMRLFYEHLKEADDIDKFYFDLVDECAIKFGKQSSKRLIVEAYVKILRYEGRLHTEPFCFLCDGAIDANIALIRAFLPVHEECAQTSGFSRIAIDELFLTHKSLNLTDEDVDKLYSIVLEGF